MSHHESGDYIFRGMRIPAHMIDGIVRYVHQGIEPGHFLRYVISNDLSGAAGRADDSNLPLLGAYSAYLYNEVPSSCWGSPEAYTSWIERKLKERNEPLALDEVIDTGVSI